ncbi:60S acidic ribosomal protein P1, putative [Trichomonas vaginalis G3]|uniref:60S acidic ribosomal protein P1, putative n=1 Tax=Trichomonas vaginalis (strain ATCC PRA-98 / G3) TaxID=412133 RepID=A2DSX3_TRIV3|nr:translational elongation [Trichomonas vaginalis G3]EAY16522.1 60S acidic ribosomal protein P1, putative [Trichomonas vaginalis G3]KAI5493575.1 translational elongation [Trichomonas vaginalis G3]|eukprot:XP_001328745.1 60S acidic ribosomal protein P1 [Trichomonas vaginalis G3]
MSAELACVYAALILNDDGKEINAESLQKILDASGVKIEKFWVDLYADYFKKADVSDLIKNVSLGGAPSAAPAAGAAPAAAADAPKEEAKEEEPAAPLDLGDMFDF